MRVMGSGSRRLVIAPKEIRKEVYDITEYKIKLLLEAHPDLTIITGMAEGFDEVLGWIALRNKIPYECYIPNPTYGEYYWGRKSMMKRNRMNVWRELTSGAEDIHYTVEHGIYTRGVHANFARNQDMIDTSNYALVYMPTSSGTKDAVSRMKESKLPYSVYPYEDTLF